MSNYNYQSCNKCGSESESNNTNPIKGKCQPDKDTIDKLIYNQVGYEGSLYVNNVATLHVLDKCCDSTIKTSKNPSDRKQPAVQRKLNYSRGPKLRPGMLNPGGRNIDVKHNSYDRYLARKKGKHLVKNKIKFSNQVPV